MMRLKYTDGSPVTDHLNVFQGIINQLAGMGIKFKNEIQGLWLLGTFTDTGETLGHHCPTPHLYVCLGPLKAGGEVKVEARRTERSMEISIKRLPSKTPQLNGFGRVDERTFVEEQGLECQRCFIPSFTSLRCKASVPIPKDERSQLEVKKKPCVFLENGQDERETEEETIPQHNDDPIDLDPVPPKHFDAQFGDDIQNDEEQK
ncbi:hypothetical protein Tco_0294499 [Tanacetum coccineum]